MMVVDMLGQGDGQHGMEQRWRLFIVEAWSVTTSAADNLLQTRRPDGVCVASSSYDCRLVPGTVRRTTLELFNHPARAEIPTRLDLR